MRRDLGVCGRQHGVQQGGGEKRGGRGGERGRTGGEEGEGREERGGREEGGRGGGGESYTFPEHYGNIRSVSGVVMVPYTQLELVGGRGTHILINMETFNRGWNINFG